MADLLPPECSRWAIVTTRWSRLQLIVTRLPAKRADVRVPSLCQVQSPGVAGASNQFFGAGGAEGVGCAGRGAGAGPWLGVEAGMTRGAEHPAMARRTRGLASIAARRRKRFAFITSLWNEATKTTSPS